MLQWVLLSYTIEEKKQHGVWLYNRRKNNRGTVSTVKLYNRRKNNRGLMLQWVLLSYTIEEKTTWGLMLQWVLLSYTIEEKTTWVWWYSEYC